MIELREVQAEDIQIFFEHMQNKDQQWLAAFVPKDPSDLEAHNQHWEKLLSNPEVFNRTITDSGEVVGHIARYFMEDMPQITYWIGGEHSGKGIGTQALALFLELETRRPLEARTAFDNLPSAKVLRKNGFKIAGTDSYFANARDAEIVETIWILE